MDVMCDLETLGTAPGCPVVTIGLVAFDWQRGELGPTFARTLNVAEQLRAGLAPDLATIGWWMRQSEAARAPIVEALENDGLSMLYVVDQLKFYLTGLGTNVNVWGNGADFDQPILAACVKAVTGQALPWPFYRNRCYRTLKGLLPDIKLRRTETHHTALGDARCQAIHAIRLLRHLHGVA